MNFHVKSMIDYINKSPTPYHAVLNLKTMLDSSGAIELDIKKPWNLIKGKTYYLINKDSSIAAFHLGSDNFTETGFRIAAAHTDSPVFRIKPNPSFVTDGYEKLNIEAYGGSILHTWLDRPLSIAGVLYIKEDTTIRKVLVNIEDPLLIIPSIAIHMNRDINENAKFNVQNDLCPLFAQNDNSDTRGFLKYIAKEANCSEEDIISFDLMTYDSSPGVFLGKGNAFISSSRLDDLSMVFSIFNGFINKLKSTDRNILALAFDHEECGSLSDRGANSNFLMMIIDRLFESINYSSEQKYIALSNSFIISGDMAHASHPSYTDKNEPHMHVYLNKGPVLKYNANQSYATTASGSAFIKSLCRDNNIPLQDYTNRSDIKGGGTIGPMLSAKYGITTVDIGNPMLAMHSARELCGSEDPFQMTKLFEVYYS